MKSRTTIPARSRADIAGQLASQFKYGSFGQQDYLRDRALHCAIDEAPQVTNAMFRQRAKQRGWSLEWLAEQVKGVVESPAATIRRVMGLADPTTVIPYPVLIDLYRGQAQAAPKPGYCRCGCGQRVMGKQRFAHDSCRKREARRVA
jgi:hypothetical protein